MRKTIFVVGLTLLVEAFSSVILVVLFLLRDKKNTAAALSGFGIISGFLGSILVLDQLRQRDRDNEDRLANAIDALWEERTRKKDIPLDDTASEEEFSF
ncbi:MAG: hypothetical protein MJ070_09470 [Lachnospiraceae bacterium]|nr:hypothetical protein [Lachnospiraceae bacterium]